ncbi:PREDICTED: uncharacterized protein LOC106343377 isoform X2 [Brassica oleracea var. oleracea]|uniref:uncharacterized protein LOC106343377 isoform X2 n=1 Tax=Brassica oleracea var. oleracea TaxID=109376 RepID=UPI0006A724D4|nr:PREDICTED: uncharacterized protein LOC106343377 isoform X2 [Brassica oleracea var. oleracea]XP_013638018.1 PREDICTED: uncharacterized protein LOC106343377 isoform X2 [Brassica oleracea var. oleracea]
MALILEASTTLSFRIYHLYGVLATSHRLGIVIDTDLGKLRSALREIVNPYENAIFVIGKTLAPSNEDNFISCFGFVDSTTHGDEVFSLHSDNSPSHGFEDVLPCYRGFTPNFPLSGTEMFRYGLGGTQTTRESNYFLTSYADCFSKCWRRAMGRHEEDG